MSTLKAMSREDVLETTGSSTLLELGRRESPNLSSRMVVKSPRVEQHENWWLERS